jgi:hypothetical protein
MAAAPQEPAPPAVVAAPVASDPSSSSPSAPLTASPSAPLTPAPPSPLDAGKIEAWFVAHGASQAEAKQRATSVTSCGPVRVGQPLEDALLCDRTEQATQGRGDQQVRRVLERKVLYVMRAQKAVALLDVVERISPLDRQSPTDANLLDLKLILDPDGQHLTLQDDPRTASPGPAASGASPASGGPRQIRGCKAAQELVDSALRENRTSRWALFDQGLIQAACQQRGSLGWQGNRLVRETKPGVRGEGGLVTRPHKREVEREGRRPKASPRHQGEVSVG